MGALLPVAYIWARERSSSLGVTARGCFAACRVAALDGSSSPCNVFLGLSWPLCCLLLCCSWGSAIAGAWAPGRSSAPCATARGRFAAYRSAALGCSVVSYAWARGRSSALLVGTSLPPLAFARTCGRPCAPAAAHGHCVAYRSTARDGCPALCVVVLGCCVAPCLAARGAPLSLVSSRLRAHHAFGGWPCALSLRVYPCVAVPDILRGTRVSHSERQIAFLSQCWRQATHPGSASLPLCRSAGVMPGHQGR